MTLTTKERLAEQVLNELNKRNFDSSIKYGDVFVRLSQTLSRVIFNRFVSTKADELPEVDGSLYYTFSNEGAGIEVQYDTVLQQYYVNLPATTTAMLYGMGLKSVAPLGSPNRSYRQVQNGFNDLFEGMEASNLEGRLGYYAEKNRIIFVNANGSNTPTRVVITMLAPFDGVPEDEEINVPSDIQGEVVDMVVAYFSNMPPRDPLNDRIDNNGTA